jgi:altered-inheritance-of-mitochondria protein 13
VQREIEAALERENLDRERGMAGEAGAGAGAESESASHGDIKNSTALLGDLEEVRQKVEKYRERASLTDHLSVKEAREAVASCYQYVPELEISLSLLLTSPPPRVQSKSDDDS